MNIENNEHRNAERNIQIIKPLFYTKLISKNLNPKSNKPLII